MGHKVEEEGRPGQAARPLPLVQIGQGRGGAPFPLSPFLPPLLVGVGEGGRRRERGRKGGAPPPLLVQFGLEREGARVLPWPPLLFATTAHVGPLNPRGGSGNPRFSGKIPISPETLPISKYRLPIYQSLCLDHFDTPRHVRDHIRDSEQPSVHQNTKTLITIVTEL